MTKFESLKSAPAQTRVNLRKRFDANLHTRTHTPFFGAEENYCQDETLLELLKHLVVERQDEPQRAREAIAAVCAKDGEAKSYDELVEEGWLIEGWHRVRASREIELRLREETPKALSGLAAWLRVCHQPRIDYVSSASDSRGPNSEAARALAKRIICGELRPDQITCDSQTWVLARLWDRDERHLNPDIEFLFSWLQLYDFLKLPNFIPSKVWRREVCQGFVDVAFEVLEGEAKFHSWEGYRSLVITRLFHEQGGCVENYANRIGPVPSSLVKKASWMTRSVMEGRRYENEHTWGHVSVLIRLILELVADEDNGPAPHPYAQRLLALAVQFPQVMSTILFIAEGRPRIVVELLMYPATSALACMLITQWNQNTSAWDRELSSQDDLAARHRALEDAMSVMAFFASKGALQPEDLAALLEHMHTRRMLGPTAQDVHAAISISVMRTALTRLSQETLQAMFENLTAGEYETGMGTAACFAALDVVNAGMVSSRFDGAKLVQATVDSVRRNDFNLSAFQLSTEGAAALHSLAARIGGQIYKDFLVPLNVKDTLASLPRDEDSYFAMSSMAQALRSQIRILCRACLGIDGPIPEELLKALRNAIYVGACANESKARVASFAARYEASPNGVHCEYGLAHDIAQVLAKLEVRQAEVVFNELLDIDEPSFFAQIYDRVPAVYRERVKQRIVSLTPDKSSDAVFYTELMHRIQLLLNIGSYDAAAVIIDSLPEPHPGIAGEVNLQRLEQRLRLALGTKQWTAIDSAVVPQNLVGDSALLAHDTIRKYVALSQFERSDGDIALAEQIFTTLQMRHRGVPEFSFHRFAAKLTRLLGRNSLVQLSGPEKEAGKSLLRDAEEMERDHMTRASASLKESFALNKAVLLLAIGRTEDAEEMLHAAGTSDASEIVTPILAVANARLGRVAFAMALLRRIDDERGPSKVVQDIRDYILKGGETSVPMQFVNRYQSDESIRDVLRSVRIMEPVRQGELLTYPPSFVDFIISEMRSMSASMIGLLPVIRTLVIDEHENHLNTLMRELLRSRLAHIEWNASDQSIGGYTRQGNAGERDAVVHKNTIELAVVEAMFCKLSADAQTTVVNLRDHFVRLLGYSTCKVLVHLTYSLVRDIKAVTELLKRIAKDDVPAAFKFELMQDLPPTDSRAPGFTAQYQSSNGPVTVIFLVLDMAQEDQKSAAKYAKPPSKKVRTKSTLGS